MGAMKLYRAWSIFNDFHKSRGVTVNWFCWSRRSPHTSYSEVIVGYDQLTSIDRRYARNTADELLTESEVAELRAYLLATDGPAVLTEEVCLPIEANAFPYTAIPTDSQGVPQGYIKLSRFGGYDLSTPIWGYYDLRGAAEGPYSERPQGAGVGSADETRTVEEFFSAVVNGRDGRCDYSF